MVNASSVIVAAAQASGGTVIETPVGTIIVLPKRPPDLDELLPLEAAARAAATSVRVLRDAIRSGALPAVGRQRDRAVRRRDLESWIESRRTPVARASDEQADRVERRLARLARTRPR